MIRKSELQLGDIIILQNGRRYTLCMQNNKPNLLRSVGWIPFDKYKEDLTYDNDSVFSVANPSYWSVKRVFRPTEQFRIISINEVSRWNLDDKIHEALCHSKEITNWNQNFIDITLYV